MFECKKLKRLDLKSAINVERIDGDVLEGCDSLEEVVIPKKIYKFIKFLHIPKLCRLIIIPDSNRKENYSCCTIQ